MYFAHQDLPPPLDWVERDFPFPLALTYARLRTAFDRQQPLEAVWAVRDAWEVAIKFCACVSVADFLHADPDQPTAERVAVGLLSDRGVAIGGWKEALDTTLREPLKEWGKAAATPTARRLPALWHTFYKPPGGKFTPHRQAVEEFTQWRNDVFGHGVFTHDLTWYAGQATAWMKKLLDLYDALKSVFDGWTLVGRTTDGQVVDWSGCDFQPKQDRHQHDPLGSALPMFLVRGEVELSFGPLLSVQRCKECDHPAAFFFDRQKTADDTVLLEYVRGAKGKKRQWDEVQKLGRWLPTGFKWERRLYDTGELLDGIPIVFRDFDREYVRPAYLLDAIRTQVDDTDKGYILLDGPEGTGKSYLARGLAEKEAGGLKVLAYYVRPGDLSHFASFLIELNRQVHDKLLPANKRTFEPQAKGAKTPAELQAEFVDYFTTVLAGRAGAVVVIDALDELPDADPTTPLITDLLPDPAKLPPNLHLVLTARAKELKPRAAARWQALAAGALRLTLDPTSAENRGLVGEYLARENVAAADDILTRSGGVFLYAWHFVAALRQGVFATTADLPPAEQFYPAFLDRIRRRVGDTLFDTVYRKLLLLLCAAKVPVTKEQIERWGIPDDRLTTALGELRDFVRQLRHRDWHEGLGDDAEPRYKIAHEAFVRYVEAHEAERLKEEHRTIATVALRHNATKWEGLDPADDADLYVVRFVLWHCDAAGMTEEVENLSGVSAFLQVIGAMADDLRSRSRHSLAVELYRLYLRCSTREGAVEFDGGAATRVGIAHLNAGISLRRLGRIDEAIEAYDRTLMILLQLPRQGSPLRTKLWVRTLMNKGVALEFVGETDEALTCYQHARDLGREADIFGSDAEFDVDVANVLVNSVKAFGRTGRLAEAADCATEAVGILEGALRLRWEVATANSLAMVYMNRGLICQQAGRLEDAIASLDQAIALRHDLVFNRSRAEMLNDLGIAIMNKGVILALLGRHPEAIESLEQAADIHREQVERYGRVEFAEDLTKTLINRAVVFARVHPSQVSEAFDDSLHALVRVQSPHPRATLVDMLVRGFVQQAEEHASRHEHGPALECFDRAVSAARTGLAETGAADLAGTLAWALVKRWLVRKRHGFGADDVRQLDEAATLYRSLVDGSHWRFLPFLLLSCVERWDVAISAADWVAAAQAFVCGMEAFVMAQAEPGVNESDVQCAATLSRRLGRLDQWQRDQLLAVSSEDVAFIRMYLNDE